MIFEKLNKTRLVILLINKNQFFSWLVQILFDSKSKLYSSLLDINYYKRKIMGNKIKNFIAIQEFISHEFYEKGMMKEFSNLVQNSEKIREKILFGQTSKKLCTVIGNDFTSSIGHSAHSIYIRLQLSKLFPDLYPYDHVITYEKPSNLHLLKKFARYFPVHENNEKFKNLDWTINERVWATWTPEGPMELHRAADIYSREFHSKFVDPVLQINDSETKSAEKFLAPLGFKENDWFVTLHLRNEAYGPGYSRSKPYGRNVSINSYLPSIKFIIEQGGWIVQIGGKGEKIDHPRIIDYRVENQNSLLNTYFLGNCKFMIATLSGPMHIPQMFNTPVVATNIPGILRTIYLHNSIIVPRLIMNHNNKIMSLQESAHNKMGFRQWTLNPGYEWIPNSSDEILEAVKEIYYKKHLEISRNQIYFDSSVRDLGSDSSSVISNYFLEKHLDNLI